MKYFIDTHDKNKGSFPAQELTEEQFFEQFAALEEAAQEFGVFGHAAHVNLKEGKASASCPVRTKSRFERRMRRSICHTTQSRRSDA